MGDAHSDQRRPRSPPFPPSHGSPSENRIALVPLSVRRQVPDLGSHRFKLRTGCRIEEMNDVLYYTLPSIAALVFPEPELLKKSWESVYRSLMPHRRHEQRVKSISEFPFAQPPHGVPGRWTDQVVRDISDYFQISPRSLPQQLIVRHLRRKVAIYQQDYTDVSPLLHGQKELAEEPLWDHLLI